MQQITTKYIGPPSIILWRWHTAPLSTTQCAPSTPYRVDQRLMVSNTRLVGTVKNCILFFAIIQVQQFHFCYCQCLKAWLAYHFRISSASRSSASLVSLCIFSRCLVACFSRCSRSLARRACRDSAGLCDCADNSASRRRFISANSSRTSFASRSCFCLCSATILCARIAACVSRRFRSFARRACIERADFFGCAETPDSSSGRRFMSDLHGRSLSGCSCANSSLTYISTRRSLSSLTSLPRESRKCICISRNRSSETKVWRCS